MDSETMADDVRLVAEWLGWEWDEGGPDIIGIRPANAHCGDKRVWVDLVDRSLGNDHFAARILDALAAKRLYVSIEHSVDHGDWAAFVCVRDEDPQGGAFSENRAEAIIRATAAYLRAEEAK